MRYCVKFYLEGNQKYQMSTFWFLNLLTEVAFFKKHNTLWNSIHFNSVTGLLLHYFFDCILRKPNTNLKSHLRIRLWFACTSDVVKAMSRQQLIFLCKTQPPAGHLRVHGPLDYWNHIPQWLKKLKKKVRTQNIGRKGVLYQILVINRL